MRPKKYVFAFAGLNHTGNISPSLVREKQYAGDVPCVVMRREDFDAEIVKDQDADMLKAARINAAITATNAELEGMKAANEDRRQNGHAMAYDAAAFDAVAANLTKRVEEILGS